jgi:hypothetical protein
LFIDNFIEFRVSLCFWGEFLVLLLANYLLISLENNCYSVQRQLVLEFQHVPEKSSSSVSMAGGRRRCRGQVPTEKAPHRDRNVQDGTIEDLQRQVAELAQRLEKVPTEEASHRDRNIQDVMIEDLQRQVVELAQRLAVQEFGNCEMENSDSDSTFDNPYHNLAPNWDHRRRERHHGALGFKVDLPEFSCTLQAEGFVDWLNELERIFEYKEVPDHDKVKLVAIKLKGRASAWWE